MKRLLLVLTTATLLNATAFAELPVVLSEPSPEIDGKIVIGSNLVHTFTITNNVPGMSAPISISGLSAPVSRVPVANDCGNQLPPGPSTCNIGIRITTTNKDAGLQFLRLMEINYQDRVPLKATIEFIVTGVPIIPQVFVAGGQDATDPNHLNAFIASSNDATASAWSVKPVPGLPAGTSNIFTGFFSSSCANAPSGDGVCVAVGGTDPALIAVTTDSGATWSGSVASNFDSLGGASCIGGPNTGPFCVIGGRIGSNPQLATNVAGEAFTPAILPTTPELFGRFSAVSCTGSYPDTYFCAAAGYGGNNENNLPTYVAWSYSGDTSWQRKLIPIFALPGGGLEITGISCIGHSTPTTQPLCVIVGYNGGVNPYIAHTYINNKGQLDWKEGNKNFDMLGLYGVSCFGPVYNKHQHPTCVAVGDALKNNETTEPGIFVSKDRGVHWQTIQGLPNGGTLRAVDCTGSGSTAICVAVGASLTATPYMAISRDGGNTFSEQITLLQPGSFTSVSCAGRGDNAICFAGGSVNNAPVIYQSNDGAQTWNLQPVAGPVPTKGAYHTTASVE